MDVEKVLMFLRFSERLGEKRTSLPFSAAVTYCYTLLCALVAEHISHPIA